MGNGVGVQQPPQPERKTFDHVELLEAPANANLVLPAKFTVRLSRECVDIVSNEGVLLCNIKYVDIESWTRHLNQFTFNLSGRVMKTAGPSKLSIALSSDSEASALAASLLHNIQQLMMLMDLEGYKVTEFPEVLKTLLNENKKLKPNWIDILGTTKKLTSFQALDVYNCLETDEPFERIDCICYLYERLLYKSMFQILVNAMDDEIERENVLHRLNLLMDKTLSSRSLNLSGSALPAEEPSKGAKKVNDFIVDP